MKYIDWHCDTLIRLKGEFTVFSNPYQVDLQRLIQIGSLGQFFAVFIDSKGDYTPAYMPRIEEILSATTKDLAQAGARARLITTKEDFRESVEKGNLGVFYTVEDAGLVGNQIEKAARLGVRLMTLTWNYNNAIAGAAQSANPTGLTSFGYEVVEEMNDRGMIIDISHLSDAGFWDVIKASKAPIVASHSNARAVWNHKRNLTDEMIAAIADKGGVIGFNFCCGFLGEESVTSTADIAKHVRHIMDVGGEDVLAIGSDFDGIDNVTDFGGISGLPALAQRLQGMGFSSGVVEKLMYKNSIRVILEILK